MRRTISVILLFIAFATVAKAQARRCKIVSLAFPCPVGLKVAHRDAVLEVFTGKDFGIFITPAEGDVDIQLLASDIVATSLAIILPKESQKFDWKSLEPSKTSGKFDTYRVEQLGFNGSIGVAVDYRIIHVRSTDVMVGYVALLGSGDEWKKIFERNSPAHTRTTMAGCEASMKLIYSLTREKWEKDKSPCSLDVRAASVSSLTFQTQSPD